VFSEKTDEASAHKKRNEYDPDALGKQFGSGKIHRRMIRKSRNTMGILSPYQHCHAPEKYGSPYRNNDQDNVVGFAHCPDCRTFK
jgi:hypothetical protein